VIIREARPDEYPAIGELRVTAYRALGLLPEGSEYIDTLRGFGFGTDCAVLVATDETGSALLGTIAIEWFEPSSELARDETEADVRAFAVAPQGQGQGVGRSLLQAVIARTAPPAAVHEPGHAGRAASLRDDRLLQDPRSRLVAGPRAHPSGLRARAADPAVTPGLPAKNSGRYIRFQRLSSNSMARNFRSLQ
jgi:GNAT superfamily N-acetyltransferase